MNIAYLASPYSHPDKKIQMHRHNMVNRVAYYLLQKRIFVFSPITHNIPIDRLGFHGDWLAWKEYDHGMLSKCDRMIVLKLEGWDESKGVAAEINKAKELNMPIEWMEVPPDLSKDENDLNHAFKDLLKEMIDLYTEREWTQFHSPKNIVMNLGSEVGELLDIFRWMTEAQSFVKSPQKLKEVKDEIADVFNMLIYLADILGIDLLQASHEKLASMAKKYPVEKCKGLIDKYTEFRN